MRFANSSKLCSPLIISPLMKKVGVELHLQHLGGVFLVGRDLVEQRLVLQAILDLRLGEAGLLADPGQRLRGVLHHPVVLLLEQHVDDGEIFRRHRPWRCSAPASSRPRP